MTVNALIHIAGFFCSHCDLLLTDQPLGSVGRERPQVVCPDCRCSFFVIRPGPQPYLLLAKWERACKDKVDV